MDCRVLRATALLKSDHFAKAIDRGIVKDKFTFLVMKLARFTYLLLDT